MISANFVDERYDDSDLTGRIIACALSVHRVLGSGFQEVVYQRSLAIEMDLQSLSYTREQEMDLYYKGYKVGNRRVDFFVEDKIMLEIKAISNIEKVHLAQAINYLEAYQKKTGLLINFGARSLQIKRVMKN